MKTATDVFAIISVIFGVVTALASGVFAWRTAQASKLLKRGRALSDAQLTEVFRLLGGHRPVPPNSEQSSSRAPEARAAV